MTVRETTQLRNRLRALALMRGWSMWIEPFASGYIVAGRSICGPRLFSGFTHDLNAAAAFVKAES